jgi:SAM-dependent methyltransferase
MNDEPAARDRRPDPARSFGAFADAYDRARPSYPREAAAWLAGGGPARLVELGAGTGKLTAELVGLGHTVVAIDPSESMLGRLATRAPEALPVIAVAERIPVATHAVDAVVIGQAFHWFDAARALPEIARVLRPGGHVGLAWNLRDERIPWVKRLGTLIATPPQDNEPTNTLISSRLFGFVETATFRFWQPMNQASLRDLVASRSNIAVMSDLERERVMRKVDAFYDDYGRGASGMLMPYITHCYRAVVHPEASGFLPAGGRGDGEDDGEPLPPEDGNDGDPLLIDFS